MKQLKVEVTQEIIANAVRCNTNRCMITDGIKESARKAGFNLKQVRTDLQTIRLTNQSEGLRYIKLTPARCQQALLDFDDARPVEPFTFILALDRGTQIIPKTSRAGKKNSGLPKISPPRVARPKTQLTETLLATPVLTGGAPTPVSKSPRVLPQSHRVFGLRLTRAPARPHEALVV